MADVAHVAQGMGMGGSRCNFARAMADGRTADGRQGWGTQSAPVKPDGNGDGDGDDDILGGGWGRRDDDDDDVDGASQGVGREACGNGYMLWSWWCTHDSTPITSDKPSECACPVKQPSWFSTEEASSEVWS